jgi:predicted phosphodiesterase
MSRKRDPEISKKVNEARELLAADSKLKVGTAAKKVGLSPQILRYRLRTEPPTPKLDSLSEEVDASEIPVFTRDYKSLEHLNVYPIGDLHIGATAHEGDRLSEWLKYIEETPGTSILNTGDNTNCALKTSVSESYDELMSVGDARKAQFQAFGPVADKIDAIIDGNHEDRVYRATGDSPNAAVAEALGINYSRSVCVVRYLVGDQSYDVFLRHGTSGGRKIGGAINNLQDQENVIQADVYVSGHTHTQVAFVKDIFTPDDDDGFQRSKRLFVCSASFVGYEEYAAKAGYVPAHIGAPRLYLDGRRHDTHASV